MSCPACVFRLLRILSCERAWPPPSPIFNTTGGTAKCEIGFLLFILFGQRLLPLGKNEGAVGRLLFPVRCRSGTKFSTRSAPALLRHPLLSCSPPDPRVPAAGSGARARVSWILRPIDADRSKWTRGWACGGARGRVKHPVVLGSELSYVLHQGSRMRPPGLTKRGIGEGRDSAVESSTHA